MGMCFVMYDSTCDVVLVTNDSVIKKVRCPNVLGVCREWFSKGVE